MSSNTHANQQRTVRSTMPQRQTGWKRPRVDDDDGGATNVGVARRNYSTGAKPHRAGQRAPLLGHSEEDEDDDGAPTPDLSDGSYCSTADRSDGDDDGRRPAAGRRQPVALLPASLGGRDPAAPAVAGPGAALLTFVAVPPPPCCLQPAQGGGAFPRAQLPPINVTPYMVYQVLRGEAFPQKILMLRSNNGSNNSSGSSSVPGSDCTPQQQPPSTTFRALVQFDTAAALQNVEERMNGALVVLARPSPDGGAAAAMPPEGLPMDAVFRLYVRRSADGRVFAHNNTASALVVTPQCVHLMGPIFERHWRTTGALAAAATGSSNKNSGSRAAAPDSGALAAPLRAERSPPPTAAGFIGGSTAAAPRLSATVLAHMAISTPAGGAAVGCGGTSKAASVAPSVASTTRRRAFSAASTTLLSDSVLATPTPPAAATATQRVGQQQQQQAPVLPAGWHAASHSDYPGRSYYWTVDPATGEQRTQWHIPVTTAG